MIKLITPYLFRSNIIVILVLLLIHFVIKECNYFFSVLYYTFPLPLIIIAVLGFAVLLRKPFRNYNLVLALVLSIVWVGRSFKINTLEDVKATDIEIVFWNATHKREFRHVFELNKDLPDIVVLVEYHAEELSKTKLQYPDYFFFWHEESEIGIFSKKTIKVKDIVVSDDETVLVNFSTNNLNFYAIDVAASMHVFRKQQMEFVTKSIKETNNVILLGDFNTPLESRFLSDIKTNFNQALNEKGNGFRETWFWNLPLLSLDHIWVSKDLQIVNAEKISTFKSDHSFVKAVIRK